MLTLRDGGYPSSGTRLKERLATPGSVAYVLSGGPGVYRRWRGMTAPAAAPTSFGRASCSDHLH